MYLVESRGVGSLRTADAFPDDRKCVCCSQAREWGERSNSAVLAIRCKTLYFTNSAWFNQFEVVFS